MSSRTITAISRLRYSPVRSIFFICAAIKAHSLRISGAATTAMLPHSPSNTSASGLRKSFARASSAASLFGSLTVTGFAQGTSTLCAILISFFAVFFV